MDDYVDPGVVRGPARSRGPGPHGRVGPDASHELLGSVTPLPTLNADLHRLCQVAAGLPSGPLD